MTKAKTSIKIVKNYDGFRGELVEIVERTAIKRRSRKQKDVSYFYSYAGKLYKSFFLPPCYGNISGEVIAI